MNQSYFSTIRIALFCFIFLLFSTGISAQQKKPNIIWITCEDISPFIGAYGDNQIKTPNIDNLSKDGIRYLNAFTCAGVCAPSRSCIITGMYPTSIGTQHMRTTGDAKFQPVPSYSAVIPDYVKCFPEYLRAEGYYCTNNEKQDYQFIPPVTVWDENGPAASYRNRPPGMPFFSIFNLFITHESQLFGRKDSLLLDPDKLIIPPYYPDTKTVRNDLNRLLTNIEMMDRQVGEIIKLLKEDGLYENTIIFFFSDHGGALPWMKREILERGTHIPLIIHLPGVQHSGITFEELVSEVDFAPTVLSLAGIKIPDYMQGQAFLGKQKANTPRKYVFSARDRMDTEYDRVRMVRDKQYRYLFNYMPEKTYYQNIEYRLGIPMMKEILNLRDAGKLDSNQMRWFSTKPEEELYDVKNDPDELHNLATLPEFKSKLDELRRAFREWNNKVGDMSGIEEKDMVRQMWNGGTEPPSTDIPEITKVPGGVKISCKTTGASIGYRLIRPAESVKTEMHTVQTWDMGNVFKTAKNGTKKAAQPVWKVYKGNIIPLMKGDTLIVNAMRIGYKPAIARFSEGRE